ncbi:tetratricopeptide repeat-containing sensor histidine kinase [Dyadobacter tibetensis]|uniref:tetratricopeptide repeat-containing sensor histidine kinase n=1 Tax=Dyadobacter tibetensis TaxID=1211851 RepID=UPI0004723BF9|nr:ATP-binding protein [Dyadobacter tibetensis]
MFLIFSAILGLGGCSDSQDSQAQRNQKLDDAREIAYEYMTIGHIDSAKYYYDSVYSNIPHPNKIEKIQRHLFYGAGYYTQLYDASMQIAHLDSIQYLTGEDPDDSQLLSTLILSLFLAGDRHFEVGSYNKAFKKYFEAKTLMPRVKDPCKRGHHQYRLGMIHYKQGLYQAAKNYFQSSFDLTANCADDFPEYALRQELLNNISLTYDRLKNQDSSAYYINLSSKLFEQGTKKFPQHVKYFNRVRSVFLQQAAQQDEQTGNINKAIYKANRAYQYLIPEDALYENTQELLLYLVRLNRKNGNLSQALRWYRALMSTLIKLPNPTIRREALLEYSHIKGMEGEYAEANSYLSEYITENKSLRLAGRSAYHIDFQEEFRNFEDQKIYQALFKSSRYQTLGLIIIAIFALLVIVITFLFIRSIMISGRGMTRLEFLHKDLAFQNWLLAGSLADLKHVNQQMDHLLIMVAKGLRGPAYTIGDYIHKLQTLQSSDPAALELLQMASQAHAQSQNMIEGLLGPEANSQEEFQITNLEQLIRDSVEQSKFSAQKKSQTLHFYGDRGISAPVQPLQLSRVINNLLANAIKFSSQHQAIEIYLRRTEQIEIEVRDFGIGIPPEMLGHIFDKVADSNRQGTDGEKSYGLGLAFCKEVIEHHQGKIWINSIPGQQTQVFISLPMINS